MAGIDHRPGPTAGPRNRSETRDRILDTAERLFLEEGFGSTSLQKIASAAGYTTGAIYSNFRGKDDLFLAVYRRRAKENLERYGRALASVRSVERKAERSRSGSTM